MRQPVTIATPRWQASRWILSPIPLVGVTIAATWLLSGVPVRSAALFIGYELAYVLLPGCLLYASLSSVRGDWLRAVVIGWPLGYALEIGAYALASALRARVDFAFLPLVSMAVMGPVLARRYGLRRMRDNAAVYSRRGLQWFAAMLIASSISWTTYGISRWLLRRATIGRSPNRPWQAIRCFTTTTGYSSTSPRSTR